jgi:hypothetical protein
MLNIIRINIIDNNTISITSSFLDQAHIPEALFNILQATFEIYSYKIFSKKNIWFLGCEIYLSSLNPKILRHIIESCLKLTNHTNEAIRKLNKHNNQADSIDVSWSRFTLIALSLQEDIWGVRLPSKSEYYYNQHKYKQTARNKILRYCDDLGIECKERNPGRLRITSQLNSYTLYAYCNAGTVSLVHHSEIRIEQQNTLLCRRIAEINGRMSICKIAIDHSDTLSYLCDLPLISLEVFKRIVQAMEIYIMCSLVELQLLAETDNRGILE